MKEIAHQASHFGLGLRRISPAEAALVDPTPLFLPTVWNAARKDVELPKDVGAFASFASKYAFEELELRALEPRNRLTTSALELMRMEPQAAVPLGFGRALPELAALPVKGVLVEVSPLSGGVVLAYEQLEGVKTSETDFWEPVEFLAVVDVTGRCAPIVSTIRPKLDEIDAFIKKETANLTRIGAKLSPGTYAIRVGP
jgi:hypothetical protein